VNPDCLCVPPVVIQAAIKDYVADDGYKKERRDIDKQLTKVTQQISGTQYNVSCKINISTSAV